MRRPDRKRAGVAAIEFALVGIPVIFLLISVFEISRGMWIYHTMAYAVKEGTRYSSVHGWGCTTSGNTCSVTVANIAQKISDSAPGLLPTQLTLTFTSSGGTITCVVSPACLANTNTWPPAGANAAGSDISISGTIPFQSALAMFWPGAGSGVSFGTFQFPASSTESITF